MASKLIAGGAWVVVQVMLDGVLKTIGLAQNASYDENWGVQAAKCLGHLGPVSLDSQDYNCSISLAAFVPERKTVIYADGGEITIEDLLPYRDDVQIDGKTREFDQLLFLNKATQKVIRSFSGCVVDSNGEQVSANAYLTENIRFLAMKRDKIPAEAA